MIEQHKSPSIHWDIYVLAPEQTRIGELEADDELEAIEKAAKEFNQTPANLMAVRR